MTKRKTNQIVKFLSVLTVLLLVVFLFAFVFKFTDGGKGTFRTFYLEYNGERITDTNSRIVLGGKKARIDLKSILGGFLTALPEEYDVQVVFNPDNAALKASNMIIGDKYWSAVEDLSSFFKIDKQSEYFELSVLDDFHDEYKLQNILEKAFPDEPLINVPNEKELSEIDEFYFFRLIVTSGSIEYKIDFRYIEIKLSQERIVF